MKRNPFLLIALGLVLSSRASGGAEPVFAPPPRLAISAAELAAAREAPDFDAQRRAAVKAADALLAKPVELPDGYGGWIFDYACPDDGTTLRPLSLRQHQCPHCKKVYDDERAVAGYRCQMHHDCEHAAVALAWAYAYTQDEKYVPGVRRILLKYADDYATYPGRLDRWGHRGFSAPLGGRRYVQSLDEAVGAVRLAKAYDLTRSAKAWSDAQRRHVEEDFFRATAQSLLRFNQDINNHQTWYNAGLICIASVLADGPLVQQVLTMRGGVYDQLKRSVGSDGLWYEGTMAYHNYALQPMIEIADAARRLGLNVHQHEKLRLMILGPLRAAYPDGSFPVINDSDPGNVSMFNWAFAWGWKNYSDPLLAQAAAHGDARKLKEMLGENAKVDWPLDLKSQALADAGLVFLRQGQGKEAACVVLDYGPHGGGHGHFDKLNICLYANGREWLLDPGRLTYSHKEYKTWVKETAAHNTVALGGKSQAATTGKLLWLKEGQGWSACGAESEGAYPGALLRRYLLLTDKLLVDVFEVQADHSTQIDWFVHASAVSVGPDGTDPDRPITYEISPGSGQRLERMLKPLHSPPDMANLGAEAGYQHLTDVRGWDAEASGVFPWWCFSAGSKPEDPKLRVFLFNAQPELRFTAFGIGYNVNQRTPTIIRRVVGNKAIFGTVYDLSGESDKVGHQTETFADEPTRLRIDLAGGKWDIKFARDSVVCKVSP